MAKEITQARIPHPWVGPMAQRMAWAFVPVITWSNLAATTNAEFVWPQYGPSLKTGPVTLRHRRPFPYLAWENHPPGKLFIPPTYALGWMRGTGPAALRGALRMRIYQATQTYAIAGTTKDSAGTALPNCILHFFQATAPFAYVGSATSDGSGNYTFRPPGNDGYSADAYLVGSPDVAGRSINGLTVTVSASS